MGRRMRNKLFIILCALALIICTALLLTGGNKTEQIEVPEVSNAEEIAESSETITESSEIKAEIQSEPELIIDTEEMLAEEAETPKTENKPPKEEEAAEVVAEVEVLDTEKSESKTITANITHYCACDKCNGKWSYTENGINYTKTAAGVILHDGIGGNYCAATFGSLGDIITINGVEYEIVDRMGSNNGYKVDIFVSEGHEKCMELGRYKAEIYRG